MLYGKGISNLAVANFFDKKHVKYTYYEDGDVLPDDKDFEIIIKSPGIPNNTTFLQKTNKLIISDLELFSMLYKQANLICITGTNGKTTVASLIYHLIKSKYKCHLGGNIGIPLFSLISSNDFKNEYVVIEASSYMLEYTYSLKPKIAIILSISPHHIDHHGTFEKYINAKLNIIKNMHELDTIIITDEDLIKDKLVSMNHHNVIISTLEKKYFNEVYYLDNTFYYNNKKIKNLYNFNNNHNLFNLQIALIVASILKISYNSVIKSIANFEFPIYRLTKIYEDKNYNIEIYNDAKATNLNASNSAIKSLSKSYNNVWWIAGGKINYSSCYIEELSSCHKALLYGENKYELAKLCESFNINYQIFPDLNTCVKILSLDKTPKCILFSPGAQSYDQFKNFEERGRYFDSLVKEYFT